MGICWNKTCYDFFNPGCKRTDRGYCAAQSHPFLSREKNPDQIKQAKQYLCGCECVHVNRNHKNRSVQIQFTDRKIDEKPFPLQVLVSFG